MPTTYRFQCLLPNGAIIKFKVKARSEQQAIKFAYQGTKSRKFIITELR